MTDMRSIAFSLGRPENRILPMGAPPGRYWTHDFPTDIGSGDQFMVTLEDVQKRLIDFDGLSISPRKRKSDQGLLPRSTELEIRFSSKVRPLRLFIKTDSSVAFVYGQIDSPIILGPEMLIPCEWTLTTFYKRKGKNKLLHAFHGESDHPVFDIHRVLGKYSDFFTIDTNYWRVRGVGAVAATTAIRANARTITEQACHITADMRYQSIAVNPEGNPELHGIWEFFRDLQGRLPAGFSGKIGLVTDTEFARLKAINRRTEPLYGSFFLPDYAEILYATSDAGAGEYMPNRLIRECDRQSTASLEEFLRRNGRQRE